jgi:predicted negative regulator of RcsB-dependent stress response
MSDTAIFLIIILAVAVLSWLGWQLYKAEKEFNMDLANYWKTYYALQETKLQIKNTKHKKG